MRHTHKNKCERKKWEITHTEMKNYLMKKTAEAKVKRKTELTRLRGVLQRLKDKTKNKAPTDWQLRGERNLQREIFKLENPETDKDPTERQATIMFDRAEAGTKAFFGTYKSRAKQSWINTLKKGTYEEDKEVTFKGTTKKAEDTGAEFVKLYTHIFSEKTISGEDVLLDRVSNAYCKTQETK